LEKRRRRRRRRRRRGVRLHDSTFLW